MYIRIFIDPHQKLRKFEFKYSFYLVNQQKHVERCYNWSPATFAIGRRLAQYLQNIPKLYRLQAFCG